MAALDAFLELDPVEVGSSVSPAAQPGPRPGADLGAPAPTAATAWVLKQQQLKLVQQPQLAYAADSDDEQSGLTSSPGCSTVSGDVGLQAALLLVDDACSNPQPAAEQQQQQAREPAQQPKLPDGTPLIASTFLDDLAAKGSVYEFCLQR